MDHLCLFLAIFLNLYEVLSYSSSLRCCYYIQESVKVHNIIHERLQILPPSARALVYGHDGWIVGGCTKYILGINDDIPKDIDIIVPFYEWGKACLIIPRGTLSNSFGGHKLTDQIAYG